MIRGGTIIDGTGLPRYTADLGVLQGRIQAVGRITDAAAQTVDAHGLVVTPGFVDGHTHMDAQVMWDPLGSCSCYHGVTSVVMSNCGFTLAPCKAADRAWYEESLAYVEDIPKEAMRAGIDWTWESFPEYLAAVEARPKALNTSMYIGHSAVRMYVMGPRATSEHATREEIERMTAIVREALLAGAIGFSTSRSHTHRAPDGSPVASRAAAWDEIVAIVTMMGQLKRGIFQLAPDILDRGANQVFLQQVSALALKHRVPIMFGILSTRQGEDPPAWQDQLETIDAVNKAGGRMYGQGSTRSINAIFSLRSYLPFDVLDAWKSIRSLPLQEQKVRLRDPQVRAQLVAAEAYMKPRDNKMQGGGAATTDARKPDYANLYAMFDVGWNDPSVDALAKAKGCHPVELMIDLCLANEHQVFVQPIVNESREDLLEVLRHPNVLATFSDSGAHVAQEMGSSLQTHLLHYWVDQRKAFSLETAIRKLSYDNASAFGLKDRGRIAPGQWADLLLLEEGQVRPELPTVEFDLPGGARRLVQRASGIHKVFVNGQQTFEQGVPTANYPGRVLGADGLARGDYL